MLEVSPLIAMHEEAARALRAAATRDLRRVYRPRRRPSVGAPVARKTQRHELVAIQQGEVVGVVEYLPRADSLFLRGLAVAPAQRRRGVARALIAVLEEIAHTMGRPRLELTTIEETGNVEIFQRLGFRRLDSVPAEAFEALDGSVVVQARMVLDLEGANPEVLGQPQRDSG